MEALASNHPFRKATLELFYNLRQNLRVTQNPEEDDKELVMRLALLYQQDREQAIKQGEQRLIIRQLNRRFGEIDSSLIEQVGELSIEQLEALGEALLDFSAVSDLETWLTQ